VIYGGELKVRISDAFRPLHVVLGSLGAAFGVFLVEGDSLCFAHEGKLDVDAVEEIGGQNAAVGCAGCDCGEFRPMPGDEGGVVVAEGGIKERGCVNKVAETLLFRAHRPGMTCEPLEKANGFVFVVDFVGEGGDGGTAKKIDGFVEAGFERTFHVIGQGNSLYAGGYIGEGAEAFIQPEGEGFGSRYFSITGFRLFTGLHFPVSDQIYSVVMQ